MSEFSHILTFVEKVGFIALNVADDEAALAVARTVAEEAGCAVVVRDDKLIEIDTISAPSKN